MFWLVWDIVIPHDGDYAWQAHDPIDEVCYCPYCDLAGRACPDESYYYDYIPVQTYLN